MRIEEYCICTHPKYQHEHRKDAEDVPQLAAICWMCDEGDFSKYHAFKLDNLQLVEDTAKAKGLI